MRKVGYLMFALCMIGACLLPFYRVDKQVEMKTVTAIVEPYADKRTYHKATLKDLRKYYKIEEQDIIDMRLYLNVSVMEAEELCIVKVSDQKNKEKVITRMQQRIEAKLKSFQGYGEQQSALIEKGSVFTKGDYVILIVSKQADAIKEEINTVF